MQRHLAVPFLLGMLVAGCSAMAKIDKVKEALVTDDTSAITAAVDGLPACPEAPPAIVAKDQKGPRETGCLREVADALGSKKGFTAPNGDNASSTAVAVVLLRDGRGDYVAHADWWLPVLREHTGSGADALRLATARKMAEAAPLVGRPINEEKEARETMKAIAGAIAGACPTYFLLGRGDDLASFVPALAPDHSACVQNDLKRREGPGPSYGAGIFRALEGALALWRETERALRLGAGKASAPAKAVLDRKLAIIEPATQNIRAKKMESAQSQQTLDFIGEAHAEAGVILWTPKKDGGAEAAAPAAPPQKR